MKVALCISGVASANAKQNVERLKSAFPYADVYTATWRSYEHNYPADFVFDEPSLDYHPVLDLPQYPGVSAQLRMDASIGNAHSSDHDNRMWKDIIPHWTKQILIHNYLLTKISGYDIIIRSRFDTIVSDKVPWEHWVEKSMEEDVAIGFNTRAWVLWNKLHEMIEYHEGYHLPDALIIHPRDLWDCELIEELHNNKKLHAAEAGWFQVLSEIPNNYFHYGYHGGAFIEKYKRCIVDYDG